MTNSLRNACAARDAQRQTGVRAAGNARQSGGPSACLCPSCMLQCTRLASPRRQRRVLAARPHVNADQQPTVPACPPELWTLCSICTVSFVRRYRTGHLKYSSLAFIKEHKPVYSIYHQYKPRFSYTYKINSRCYEFKVDFIIVHVKFVNIQTKSRTSESIKITKSARNNINKQNNNGQVSVSLYI